MRPCKGKEGRRRARINLEAVLGKATNSTYHDCDGRDYCNDSDDSDSENEAFVIWPTSS